MRQFLLAVLLLSTAVAKDKPAKVYPERGTVVAMRTERATRGGGVYTDNQGRTHGGGVHSVKIPVYKVRNADMDFELEGRTRLSIGDQVSFRIEKNRVYVQDGSKERKFSLVGQEQRSAP
jgi:hypothetical protein